MSDPTDTVADLLASVTSFATTYEAAVVPRATALLAQAKAVRDAYAESIPKRRRGDQNQSQMVEQIGTMRTRLVNLNRIVDRLELLADASKDLHDTVWWAQ